MRIKIIPSILMSLCCALLAAQESTEIYLFDLSEQDNQITISNPVNISKNEGYDNQPSFTEDGTGILFSSFRDGQADISKYFIAENYRVWITDTKESEFSPQQVPGKKKYFTCVRLNEDETQYIYKYAFKKKPPELFVPDLKVGYYMWFDPKTLISFVIGDTETLQVSSFKHKIRYPIRSNIGRSMHTIPESAGLGSNLISFISLSHESPEIYSIDPFKSTSEYIADALEGSRDLTWTAKGTMLMGKNNMIYKFHPGTDKKWVPITIETEFDIQGISRIIISPDGTKLALVATEPTL